MKVEPPKPNVQEKTQPKSEEKKEEDQATKEAEIDDLAAQLAAM